VRAELKVIREIEGDWEGGRPFSSNCVLSWKISITCDVTLIPCMGDGAGGKGVLWPPISLRLGTENIDCSIKVV